MALCLFKEITGMPCPGCGSIRAGQCLLNGDIGQALWYNPVAVLLYVVFAFILFYSAFDWIFHKRRPWDKEAIFGRVFKRRWPAWTIVLAAVITAANWYWNIKKGI